MYLSTISIYLVVLFVISLLLPLIIFSSAILSAGSAAGMPSAKVSKIQFWVIGFLISWWIYAAYLSISGFLYGNALPPKPVLFLILPLLLFLFFVVKRSCIFKTLFEAVSIETLINIHVFRLIGAWFLVMAYHDLLPMGFAMRAGWGDILTGVSALLISYLVFKKKRLSIKWAYAWNIFGLVDILSVVISAIVITATANSEVADKNNVLELTMFPFALIPTFAPAIILFLHIITFKKLGMISNKG